MTIRAACVRCGSILHTGEGKITMQFSVEELIDLFKACEGYGMPMLPVMRRISCAVGLLDESAERDLWVDRS